MMKHEEYRHKLSCFHCKKKYSSKASLKAHLITHNPNRPSFPCTICNAILTEKSVLQHHIKTVHRSEQSITCPKCKKSFTEKGALKRHLITHDPNRPLFPCTMCHAVFTVKDSVHHHINTVHRADRSHLTCPKCKKYFSEKGALRKHMLRHDKSKEKCTECNAEVLYMERHMKNVHRNANKHFTCSKCQHEFTTDSSLKRHVKHFHSDNRPSFVCHLCDNVFTFKHTLKRHLQTHNTEKNFACTLCNMKFTSNRNLKNHEEKHKENRQKQCTICGKMYLHISSHMKRHAGKGKRQYKEKQCPKCKRQINATNPANFWRHVRSHTDRVLSCPLCQKTFRHEISLQHHQKMHEGTNKTTCTICNKQVVTWYMNRHMETHKDPSERKLISCYKCEKQFTDKSSLRHHLAAHNGTNKKACRICGKHVVKLKQHLRKVHKNNSSISKSHILIE